jgi:hypothetical protein
MAERKDAMYLGTEWNAERRMIIEESGMKKEKRSKGNEQSAMDGVFQKRRCGSTRVDGRAYRYSPTPN